MEIKATHRFSKSRVAALIVTVLGIVLVSIRFMCTAEDPHRLTTASDADRLASHSSQDTSETARPKSTKNALDPSRNPGAPGIRRQITLVMLDELTRTSLPAAKVKIIGSDDRLDTEFLTNDDGTIGLEVEGDSLKLAIEPSIRHTELKFERTITLRTDSDTTAVALPVFGIVEVVITTPDFNWDSGLCEAIAISRREGDVQPLGERLLNFAPRDYARLVGDEENNSIDHKRAEFNRKNSLVTFQMCHEGDVYIEARIPGFGSANRNFPIKRGVRTRVELDIPRSQAISGLLVDRDTRAPIPNVPVWIACRSRFTDGDLVPKSTDLHSTWIGFSRRGDSTMWWTSRKKVQTDDQGRFRLLVPFTDEIAVWTFLEHGKAIKFTTVGARQNSVEPIVLELVSYESTRASATFISARGEPLRKNKIKVLIEQSEKRISIVIPELMTDEFGRADASSLEPGTTYHFRVEGTDRYYVAAFTDGAVYTMPSN